MVKPDGASIGKLKEKLLEFTQQWIQERPYEGLVIVEDRVIFQNREGQQEVSIQELLAEPANNVLRNCIKDLDQPGVNAYNLPEYMITKNWMP